MTPREDIQIIQVSISSAQRALLLKTFPPVHTGKITAEHATVAFAPNVQEMERFELGAQVIITVIGYAQDSRGQAVAVELINAATNQPIPCKNAIPHITISCAEGTKPVYSNELLAKGSDRVKNPLVLMGTCVALLRNGTVISSE